MKKLTRYSTLLITTMLITACGDSTPNCNSEDAKQTVIDITKEQMKKFYWMKEMLDGTYEVVNVRTQSHDSGTDMYSCAADMNLTVKGNTTSTPITYTIQKTEDQAGMFYVEVFGL